MHRVLSSYLDLDPALVAMMPGEGVHADGDTGPDAPHRPQHFLHPIGHRGGVGCDACPRMFTAACQREHQSGAARAPTYVPANVAASAPIT